MGFSFSSFSFLLHPTDQVYKHFVFEISPTLPVVDYQDFRTFELDNYFSKKLITILHPSNYPVFILSLNYHSLHKHNGLQEWVTLHIIFLKASLFPANTFGYIPQRVFSNPLQVSLFCFLVSFPGRSSFIHDQLQADRLSLFSLSAF